MVRYHRVELIFDRNIYIYTNFSIQYEYCVLFSFAGPLTVVDPDTGLHTLIGVASAAATTLENYRFTPSMRFAPVDKVLPWIKEVMSKPFSEDVD